MICHTGHTNTNLAIAKNTEIPGLLRAAGELTPHEDTSIYYTQLKSKQPVYVGKEGDEIWYGTYLDEKAIFDLPTAGNNMKLLRQILLKRGTGKFHKHSEIEAILARRDITKDDDKSRRSHVLGFTCSPEGTRAGLAETNNVMLREQDRIAN